MPTRIMPANPRQASSTLDSAMTLRHTLNEIRMMAKIEPVQVNLRAKHKFAISLNLATLLLDIQLIRDILPQKQ